MAATFEMMTAGRSAYDLVPMPGNLWVGGYGGRGFAFALRVKNRRALIARKGFQERLENCGRGKEVTFIWVFFQPANIDVSKLTPRRFVWNANLQIRQCIFQHRYCVRHTRDIPGAVICIIRLTLPEQIIAGFKASKGWTRKKGKRDKNSPYHWRSSPSFLGVSVAKFSKSPFNSKRLLSNLQAKFVALNCDAASSERTGGEDGFCKTEIAHSRKGSLPSPFGSSERTPTAMPVIVEAICNSLCWLFQTKSAIATTIGVTALSVMSALSHPSFSSAIWRPFRKLLLRVP